MKSRNASRKGMTLIEVIVSIGVFTVCLCWSLQAVSGTVAANRTVMAGISANSVIRAKAEEVLTIATETCNVFNNYAQGVVNYYGTKIATVDSTFGDNGIDLGPNGSVIPRVQLLPEGVLIYTFSIPEPGDMHRVVGGVNHGQIVRNRRGVGQAVFYVEEARVPGDLRYSPGTENPLWYDDWPSQVGDNERSEPVKAAYSASDLSNPDALGLRRLFVDIIVTYYSDASHERVVFTSQRRLMVPGSVNGGAASGGSGGPGGTAGIEFGMVTDVPETGLPRVVAG